MKRYLIEVVRCSQQTLNIPFPLSIPETEKKKQKKLSNKIKIGEHDENKNLWRARLLGWTITTLTRIDLQLWPAWLETFSPSLNRFCFVWLKLIISFRIHVEKWKGALLDRKGGFWRIFENNLDFKDISWIYPWFQVNLEINIDFINGSCAFWRQPWFQGNLNYSQVNNTHTLFTTHEWDLKRVWIL